MLKSLSDLVVYLLLALAVWVESLSEPVVYDIHVVSEGEEPVDEYMSPGWHLPVHTN